MINVQDLIKVLKKNEINFYTGVPDSVLKNFTRQLDKEKKFKHLILANEGSAVSAGIGYYLSTKKIPAVYMQNSGLGNSLNPIISIAHKKVYRIPLFLIIGWRGAPNLKDEPQHLAQGKVTRQFLKLCGIKYLVLEKKTDLKKIEKLINFSKKKKEIVAILIKKNSLKISTSKKTKKKIINSKCLTRSIFIEELLKCVKKNYKFISSTGYLSRELYNKIKDNNLDISPFYMVGGMGHTSIVSLGYSLKSNKKIICLDGDGSFLMHLGSVVSIIKYAKNNFKYILLNNNAHESVGGQTTNIENINLKLFSKSVGYKKYFYLNQRKKSHQIIKSFLAHKGPSFLEVNIKVNLADNNLPRPKNLNQVIKRFSEK